MLVFLCVIVSLRMANICRNMWESLYVKIICNTYLNIVSAFCGIVAVTGLN